MVVDHFGRVKLTLAFHGSALPDGSYGGNPCGFVLKFNDGKKVYDAADTGLFGDMKLIGELYHPEVAMLPIGGFYTMGPKEAALAVQFLAPKMVLPIHFGTFPPLTGTPDELGALIDSKVQVVRWTPGQTI